MRVNTHTTQKDTQKDMGDDNRRTWIDVRVMETSREKDESWEVSVGTQGLPVKGFCLAVVLPTFTAGS